MKFRGMMADYNIMKDFLNIVISLSKLSKECVLRILPDKIYFIIPEDEGGPRRPFIWCELLKTHYFREYTMGGVSEEFNEIYLAFETEILADCLTSVKMAAKSLKLKLTNKEQEPCLTLEIEMASNDVLQKRECVHDIPVEVIPRKHWTDYCEPVFDEYHVTIQMPTIKSIKNIVERMKAMSPYLIVSANKSGRVTLKIETNLVTLSAHFPNMTVQSFAEGIDNDTVIDDDEDVTFVNTLGPVIRSVSSCIDARKLLCFLTAMHLPNCRMICSIVQGRMVKIVLECPGSIALQCFLTEVSQ